MRQRVVVSSSAAAGQGLLVATVADEGEVFVSEANKPAAAMIPMVIEVIKVRFMIRMVGVFNFLGGGE